MEGGMFFDVEVGAAEPLRDWIRPDDTSGSGPEGAAGTTDEPFFRWTAGSCTKNTIRKI